MNKCWSKLTECVCERQQGFNAHNKYGFISQQFKKEKQTSTLSVYWTKSQSFNTCPCAEGGTQRGGQNWQFKEYNRLVFISDNNKCSATGTNIKTMSPALELKSNMTL